MRAVIVCMEERTGSETMCPACTTDYIPTSNYSDFSMCKYRLRFGVDLCFKGLGQKSEKKMERTSTLIQGGKFHTFENKEKHTTPDGSVVVRAKYSKVEDAKATCGGTRFRANDKTKKGNYYIAGVAGAACPHGMFLGPLITAEKGERYHYAAQALHNVYAAIKDGRFQSDEVQKDRKILLTYDIHCLWKAWLLTHSDPRTTAWRQFVDICGPVFHITTHDLKCFLTDNVRFRDGCGMRDGEAIERVWATLKERVAESLSHMGSPARADALSFTQFTMNAHTRTRLPSNLAKFFHNTRKEKIAVNKRIEALPDEKCGYGTFESITKELLDDPDVSTLFQLELLEKKLLHLRNKSAAGGMIKRLHAKLLKLGRKKKKIVARRRRKDRAARRQRSAGPREASGAVDSNNSSPGESTSGDISPGEATTEIGKDGGGAELEKDDRLNRLNCLALFERRKRIDEEGAYIRREAAAFLFTVAARAKKVKAALRALHTDASASPEHEASISTDATRRILKAKLRVLSSVLEDAKKEFKSASLVFSDVLSAVETQQGLPCAVA